MTPPNFSTPSGLGRFLYTRSRYHGQSSPEHVAFNASLQVFSQRVNYICALETGGKLTAPEAYQQLKQQWKTLKRHRRKALDSQVSDDVSGER